MATTDTPTSRRRWVIPASLGAIAAATIAVIIGVTGPGDESIESPVVTEPSVPSEPTSPTEPTEPTTAPEPTEPTSPGTSTPDTTPPTESGVTVTDVGWDGPGSACLTLDGATGCLPAGAVRGGDVLTTADVVGATAHWQLTLFLRDGEIATSDAVEAAPRRATGFEVADGIWLLDVTEAVSGDAAIRGVLPTGPEGEVRFEALRDSSLFRADGEPEVLSLGLLGDTVVDGGPGLAGFRVFEASVPTGDLDLRCLLAVPGGGVGWWETCELTGFEDPTARGGLFWHPDGLVHLDLLAGTLTASGDAPVRTNGCEAAVRFLGAQDTALVPVIYRSLGCDEGNGLATATFGSVFVQAGPPDGGIVEWERNATGTWSVTDMGTGIEPRVLTLPVPPAEMLQLDRDVAALPIEDVTQLVRGWFAANPGATVAEVVAENEGEPGGEPAPVETLVPGSGLPTLVVVEATYFDDSVGAARYAVWITEPDDDSSPYLVAYRWLLCERGLTGDGADRLCI